MPSTERDKTKILSKNLFPVVGIGASAGGLDAFKKLLGAIPEESGIAYVLVQHLDPKHESMLPELLQKVTKIPVMEITDDIRVEPNHIYIIPSNKMMIANDGVLKLKPRPEKGRNERNLAIDLFFTSLAEVHQEFAIGVVLSGTASDGTQGLKAIKDHGGITFAQDEESAEYEGMPHSAALAGVVDFILPPEKMPKKLLEVISKTVITDDEIQNIPQQQENVFKQILSLLTIRMGVDFTYYKQTTIRRRIFRRMVVNKNEEPGEYLKFLRANIQEQDLLYQDLLIPVTSFFRDKKTFDNLSTLVFPSILKNKTPGEITRIWVAGCSTGQEVYSIAICLKEFLGDQHERIQIFGTDLSEPAIVKARNGLYEKIETATVSPERLQKFFTKSNGSYQVNKSIRDMCVFAHHNFLKDPPFGKMDVISCRNVLIYMEPYLQKRALTTFHYALNTKGFLLLGTSETTAGVSDLFEAATKTDKLFTRKNVPGKFIKVASQRSEQVLNRLLPNGSKNEIIRTDFQKTADDILLTKYTPAGVVVNETLDILHFRGNTTNYLEQAPGKPSHNLLMMAKPGLAFELRNILHKAKAKKITVVKENIPVDVNGAIRNISLEAIPLPNTVEPFYLILFHDNDLNNSNAQADSAAISKKKTNFARTKNDEKDLRIRQLEEELLQVREDMRSITEEQEAANEELQSANEELLSSSEELQSLNEELETSKEELQSTNEELTVLNHELINLNEQVTDARNYSESIVATLYQPLLVLDKNLRVKTANQAFYKTFKVNEQETEGVLIYDLGNRQWNIPELRTLLEEILPQKKQITDYKVTHNFLSIGERIILLSGLELTREKKEEKLILLSIEDITDKEKYKNSLIANEKRFRSLIVQATHPICILKGKEMVLEVANEAILKLWGAQPEMIGKPFLEILPEMNEQPFTGWLHNVYKNGVTHLGKEEPAYFNRKDGTVETIYFNFSYQPYLEDDGTISGVMVIADNVTEQVLARKRIEESEAKYRSLFETMEQGFCIIELIFDNANRPVDYLFVEVNPVFEQQSGLKDAAGKTILELVPDFERKWMEIFGKVVATGQSTQLVEGSVALGRMFEINAFKVGEAESRRVAVLFTDVTERKRAEQTLVASESRFRNIVEKTSTPICILKGEDMILDVANESVFKIWHVGNEAIGKPFLEIIPEMKDQPFMGYLLDVYKNGITHYGQEEPAYFIRENGEKETLYFNFVYQPYREDDGTITGVMVLATDVSEQVLARRKIEESEEQFRILTNSMPQKIWTADAKGNKNYFNQTLLDYAGFSFEELKGEGWQKIIHPDDWEKDKKQWEESISTGKDYETENRLLRKDGEYLWHLTRAVALKDEDGKIKMWVGSKTEIHDQKTKEQAKDEFIAIASHELKTPLTTAKAYIQLVQLSMEKTNDKDLMFAKKAGESIDRLNNLIAELLDVSKIQNGKLPLHISTFNFNDMITASIEQLQYGAPMYSIIKSGEIDQPVTGDKQRLQQVVINLLTNAIKYSPKNYKVFVHLVKENGEVTVSVKDNGIGIRKENLKKIFERYYREDGRSIHFQGLGIGLSICYEIIQRHNGKIWVQSEPDRGSTFYFTLPR